MIKEEYVSFEVARLLKDKGFDQNCATYYLDGQVWRHYHGEVIPKDKQIYAAPTQAMAIRWLREVHNFHVDSSIYTDTDGDSEHEYTYTYWDWLIFNSESGRRIAEPQIGCGRYDSYEQACEAAIKYCLENLI